MQNDKSRFGLQKPLFCNAKGTVPPCKTGTFAMRKMPFCKVLIMRLQEGLTMPKFTSHVFVYCY